MFLYLLSLFKRVSLSTIFYLCGNGSDTPVPLGVETAELPKVFDHESLLFAFFVGHHTFGLGFVCFMCMCMLYFVFGSPRTNAFRG